MITNAIGSAASATPHPAEFALAAVEAVEDGPQLAADRGETAEQLHLERQTGRAGDEHRGEPLPGVQQPAHDPLGRADALPEIAATELP